MLRKTFILLLVTLSLAFQVGCSSSDESSEEDVKQSDALEQEVAEGGEDAGGEAGGGGDTASLDDEGSDGLEDELEDTDSLDDEELAEGDGDSDLDEATDGPEDEETAVASNEEEAAPADDDMPVADNEEPASDVPLAEEPREDMTYTDTSTSEPSALAEASDEGMEEAPKAWVPVKKVATEPFNKAGVLVNAVYIAREGDTIDSISQKIFGTADRAGDLLNVNTTLGRGVKVGDKVYYNSPQRPNDNSQLLTFYEDAGLAPEEYITQEGDNVRVVAKKLLGHDRSWMELYATNQDLDSKNDVAGGYKLRYWGSAPDFSVNPPTQEVAAAEPPPAPEEPNNMPPPPEPTTVASNDLPPPPPAPGGGMNDLPPPPPAPDTAMNDLPPPPPAPDANAAASIAPPPPPPVADLPPPPSPAKNKLKKKKRKKRASASAGMDENMLILGAGALLILVGLALFIIKKKKGNKQDIDFHTATHTQIE